MMRRPNRRRGLSLLEAVIAMAILLISVAALAQLISIGSTRALDVQQEAQGSMLCQRKLAELAIGAEALGSTGYQSFPEQGLDEWQWKVDANESVTGLWNVQVTVKYESDDGRVVEVQLGQMMLDPTTRGSNQDPPASQSSSSSSSSSGSGSSTPSSGTAGAAATTPSTASKTAGKGN